MGLNKPIIISTSAVDTSNLATKSDMTTLQNSVTSALSGVGGAVKSVQKGFIKWNTETNKYLQGKLARDYDHYIDVTISAVNLTKTILLCESLSYNNTYNYTGEFVNSSTLRIFISYNRTSGKEYVVSPVFWQVVEFN